MRVSRFSVLALALALAVTACGDGESRQVSTQQDGPPSSDYQDLSEENVNPDDGEFDRALSHGLLVEWEPIPEDQLAEFSTLVVRGIAGEVERLGSDSTGAIGEVQGISALYAQTITVDEVLAIDRERLTSAQLEAVDSGSIRRVFNGPNAELDAVVSAIAENRVLSPEKGTGVIPSGVEMVFYLKDSALQFSESEAVLAIEAETEDAFTDSCYICSYFYVDGDTLVRPTHPLVGSLPDLELSYVNQASLRESVPIDFGVWGLRQTLPLAEQVSDFSSLGVALEPPAEGE